MPEHFNKLTPAQAERLAILMEECAEVQQVIGKILRHGYSSTYPANPAGPNNRELLTLEVGHLVCAIELVTNQDLNPRGVEIHKHDKKSSMAQYLHHQRD